MWGCLNPSRYTFPNGYAKYFATFYWHSSSSYNVIDLGFALTTLCNVLSTFFRFLTFKSNLPLLGRFVVYAYPRFLSFCLCCQNLRDVLKMVLLYLYIIDTIMIFGNVWAALFVDFCSGLPKPLWLQHFISILLLSMTLQTSWFCCGNHFAKFSRTFNTFFSCLNVLLHWCIYERFLSFRLCWQFSDYLSNPQQYFWEDLTDLVTFAHFLHSGAFCTFLQRLAKTAKTVAFHWHSGLTYHVIGISVLFCQRFFDVFSSSDNFGVTCQNFQGTYDVIETIMIFSNVLATFGQKFATFDNIFTEGAFLHFCNDLPKPLRRFIDKYVLLIMFC